MAQINKYLIPWIFAFSFVTDDDRKVQLAILARPHTRVSKVWIAQKLAMRHRGHWLGAPGTKIF